MDANERIEGITLNVDDNGYVDIYYFEIII